MIYVRSYTDAEIYLSGTFTAYVYQESTLIAAFASVLLCLVPILFLPLVAGLAILRIYTTSTLVRFTGWLTIKPVIVTPIWLGISAWIDYQLPLAQVHTLGVLAILPGILFTVMLVWIYRAMFAEGYPGFIVILLVLDVLRWGSTFVAQRLAISGTQSNSGAILLLAVGMPFVFALLATGIVHVIEHEEQRAHASKLS